MLAETFAGDEDLYLLEQQFRYTYASPVRRLRHRLVVVPRAVHGGQYRYRRRAHGVRRSRAYDRDIRQLRQPHRRAACVRRVRGDRVSTSGP